ncbi:MAG TPA: hypothetical protein VJ822_10750 [Dongiaceae bacterium]|nr:hypothetical protein [Dongiaceae bacterium]
MTTTDRELQGWYHRNRTSDAERVRLSFAGDSLALHTLSERLIATWSLEQLENREIAHLGERWSIGDRRLPESYLVLENDQDYRALRQSAPRLRPVRARVWRQLGFSAIESGKIPGWPVIVLILLVSAITALWQLF